MTNALREKVRLCKADGWSDDRIARLLGIARNTLMKHFRDDLDTGADVVRADAMADLKKASKKGNAAASKALLSLAGLTPPKPMADPKTPAVGKKEQQRIDAQTAEQGTGFGAFVKH